MNPGALPTGRAGPALALGLVVVVLLGGWFTAAAPLLEWHAARAERIDQRRILARRMGAVAATLPRLRLAETAAARGMAPGLLVQGASDAVAAATLQERVQEMARTSGAALGSTETLPAAVVGDYRRIGLHVTLSAPYAVMVRLLEQVEQSSPRMLVDDLALHGPQMVAPPADPPLEAGFTVFAFRLPSGTAAP